MAMTPVARSAVSDGVFSQLCVEILSGRMGPADPLPAERELADVFQVNRHAVREALKRLQQLRLVTISQGGKTLVLDWRTHAGLDVLVQLVEAGVVPPAQVLHDILEMRRTVGADAARLCAKQADDAALARVVAAARAYPESVDDVEALVEADRALWDAIIDGSGNVAYRLALNTLVAGFDRIGVAAFDGPLMAELVDRPAHVELADKIAARLDDAAYQHAFGLLDRVVTPATVTV